LLGFSWRRFRKICIGREVLTGMSDDDRAKVTLRLPSTLSAYSGGKSQIQLRANSVEQLLSALASEHPRVWEHLCNEQGHLREHVKMFVSNELITGANGLQTPLKSGQEIIVLPVISS
jgi:molybdopterin converting factor small subunit